LPDATVVFDQPLAELVWDAASHLSREEYSLLALHVRHDLAVDELGESAARLARARKTFDERVSNRLVAERARHICTELEILAAQNDEREIARHIRGCERCRESREAFVSPATVLGGLAQLAPPRGLAREIFKRAPRRRVFGIL
jgi:hypothetical protein